MPLYRHLAVSSIIVGNGSSALLVGTLIVVTRNVSLIDFRWELHMGRMRSLSSKFITGETSNGPGIGIAIVRVTLGVVMFAHGAQKVPGWFGGKGLDASTAMMAEHLGIPMFFVYLSVFTEFLGGLLLILGLFTRPAAVAVTINMTVALMQHISNGFFLPKGAEFAITLALMSLAVLIAGPGVLSLDRLLFRSNER